MNRDGLNLMVKVRNAEIVDLVQLTEINNHYILSSNAIFEIETSKVSTSANTCLEWAMKILSGFGVVLFLLGNQAAAIQINYQVYQNDSAIQKAFGGKKHRRYALLAIIPHDCSINTC